ncbi:hypothetical protein ABZS29_01000 [Kribbella sp. NPDC005582]|uniref:hypothetical protein n=1 Tax=Kribbella sp. NPDC005582 TaxID=3156893 RepID=UPI0033AE3BC8
MSVDLSFDAGTRRLVDKAQADQAGFQAATTHPLRKALKDVDRVVDTGSLFAELGSGWARREASA